MHILGARYRKVLEPKLGRCTEDDIFWLPDNPMLGRRLSGHADLSVFAAGNKAVISPEEGTAY